MNESQSDGAASPSPNDDSCEYHSDRSVTTVALKPALSDVKWDQIESIGQSIEDRLKSDKPNNVVFDISGLTYMGSAMVALVVRWWKTVESSNGNSVVVCRDANVFEVLKLASLDEHWTIVPTTESAYKTLGVSAPARSVASSAALPGGANGASAEGEGSVVAGLLAALATAGAVAGLVLGVVGVVDQNVGSAIGLSFAAVGVIIGLIGAVLSSGKGRTLAILFLVLSLAAGGATFALLGVADFSVRQEADLIEPETAEPETTTEPVADSTRNAEPTGETPESNSGDAT